MIKRASANNVSERQKIVNDLKEGIVNGVWESGQRLVEAHLCKHYGVSRGKIREVLRELEQDGFVRIAPHIGATVTRLTQQYINNSYDLMGVLEGLSVRVATPFLTSERLSEIGRLLEMMDSAQLPSEYQLYNTAFHNLLISLSENEQLLKFADNLRFILRRFGFHGLHNPNQISWSKKEHRNIYEAMKEGAPEKAECLVRDHYLGTKLRLIKYINKSL